MKNTILEEKANSLKRLLKKPELLLKKVEVMERQIKTLQVRIDLSSHKNIAKNKKK